MALLEAMACGCAPVASRVGGVPEVIEDERSGLLVDPAKPAQLATALERLVRDPALRERLGRAARRRIEQSFSLEGTVRRHEELYSSLLTSGAGPGATDR